MTALSQGRLGEGTLTATQQMISSCSGAFITSVFVTPLDVVKIRLQAQQKPQNFAKGHCYLYCNGLMDHTCLCINGGNGPPAAKLSTWANKQQWYRRPGNFRGMTDAFISIGKTEGIASLWSGLPPTLVMAVPATVIYFTCYDQLKYYLNFKYEDSFWSSWWRPMAAGSLARVFAVSVISPLEMLRTKMQSEQVTYRQLGVLVSRTVKQDGILSMYKGLGPTLLRDIPFSALYWLGYESMKAKVLKETGTPKLTFMESFLTGAISGSVAGILTLPFDVIKTHRQIELGEVVLSKDAGKKEVSSTWRLIQNLYRQQGIKALFSGLTPRVVKVAPACAIMISSYEFFKAFFMHRNYMASLEV